METWEPGATDVDFYVGVDRVGRVAEERAVFGGLLLGYGLVRNLSAYLATTLSANHLLTDGEPNVHVGLFGTVLDTDHLDLDLFLEIGSTGDGLRDLELAPALELNLDRLPDLAAWGAYVRVRAVAHTHHDGPPGVALEVTPGAYWTVVEGRQLLVELDLAYHPQPGARERELSSSGVAVGTNWVLSPALELVTQVVVGLDAPAFGVAVGFVATLDND